MKRFLFFAVVTLFLSCSKQGPAGPQGLQGQQGVAGQQGPTGNANVMVDTFTLTSSQFAYSSYYTLETASGFTTKFTTRYHDCPFPAVTPAVLASGMVLAYFVPDPSYPNQWAPLPYSYLAFTDAYYYNFVYKTDVGVVTIHYFYTLNGTTVPPSLNLLTDVIATHRYKLVAVSGQIADAMRRSNVDVNDEAAVSRFLGAAPGVFGVDRRVLPVALIR